jgi:hypothetical protein
MSRVGPFGNAPQLVERKARLIDMMVRDQAEVSALQFYGARTLDAAYVAPTASGMPGGAGTQASPLFTVGRSQQFRSQSVGRRRWSWYGETLRGMSRVAFDPTDYAGDISTNLPSDEEYWYVRMQESRPSVGAQAAVGNVDLSAVAALDTVLIAGITFTAIAGAGTPAAQTFDGSAGGATAATELIAAINEVTTSQPLILAAPPAGVTVTASPGAAADQVVLTASVAGTVGNQITLSATGTTTVSGPALAGGGSLLVVRGPVDTSEPKLGPIYIVPTPEFFGQSIPTLNLAGTAPAGTTAVAGSAPPIDLDMQIPNPMHVVLPRTTSSITINNHDPANTLLISTGMGAPMVAVGFDEDPLVVFGSFKEIVLAGVGGAVPFSINAVVALGADG